jgi:CRISPR/Cas system endoribonuclease Cas6 (RAMP superfamily)
MTFIPLKNILVHNINAAGISHQVSAAQAIKFFDEVIADLFGEKIKGKAKAIYLKNETLTISCPSSAIIQEMYLRRNKIIEGVNKKLDKEAVKKLKFRI